MRTAEALKRSTARCARYFDSNALLARALSSPSGEIACKQVAHTATRNLIVVRMVVEENLGH